MGDINKKYYDTRDIARIMEKEEQIVFVSEKFAEKVSEILDREEASKNEAAKND